MEKVQGVLTQLKANWVQILLAVLSAGFVAEYFGLIKLDKELSQADKTLLIEELRNDRNYYQTLYRECQEDFGKIQNDLAAIRTNSQLLEAVRNDLPVPVWLKDPKGRMIFLNNEYERVFLLPKGKRTEDYINHTDYDIWDKETADAYKENDLAALRSNAPFFTTELIPMEGTKPKEMRVVKYIQRSNGRAIGIGGIGIWIN